jgi:hypothetical protein
MLVTGSGVHAWDIAAGRKQGAWTAEAAGARRDFAGAHQAAEPKQKDEHLEGETYER